MTIQVLRSFISSDVLYTPGVETEVEDALATDWIAAGLAAPVNPES